MVETEVIELLNNNQSNIICRDLEFKPTNLAMYIATLANNAKQSGYILIGVSFNRNSYEINGVSKDFKIKEPLEKAISQLTNPPKIVQQRVSVKGRDVLVIKVERKEDSVFFNVKLNDDEKIDLFIKDILRACVKLQANIRFKNVSEDERNDYIRDLLSMKGYFIKDQTRRGYSSSGKSTGEVDIFIEINDMPFSIVEALNLNSLNISYLNTHLDKIYSYDTTGNKFNVCLSYVEIKDFGSFWEKYCDYVSTYSYPIDLVECRKDADKEFPYSEIRFMTTTHNRNGKPTLLYHVAVKM